MSVKFVEQAVKLCFLSRKNVNLLFEDNSDDSSIFNKIKMEGLRDELDQWEPYGNQLLYLYLSGKKRLCTKEMSAAIGITEQYFRRKKKEFESIVNTFLNF